MPEKLEIEIYTVGEIEPADGSLVVGWTKILYSPQVLEFRKRKGGFYNFITPAECNFFFYLSDLIGLEQMQKNRTRADIRDDKKPRIMER